MSKSKERGHNLHGKQAAQVALLVTKLNNQYLSNINNNKK